MRFFIAGIMQGSHAGEVLHHQGYREKLKELLVEHVPGAVVYDPLSEHRDSLEYDHQRGREVFLQHNRMCGEMEVLIAFVPEASMGTAIEMWEAFRHGRFVVTISPLRHNWVVRFCSHEVFADLESFAGAVRSGELCRRISPRDGSQASDRTFSVGESGE
ncbi:MAG: hypothetical protein ACQESR_14295 [Planctomycetota bacterium]